MRHELNAEDGIDFLALVNRLGETDTLVRRHATELKRFAKLRNLIAHHHSHNRPLAVPTLVSVERAEALDALFRSPPLLLSLATKPVAQCQSTDPLGCCVRKMHDGVFSQLPVYEGDRYYGLLTAETIARWLASSFVGDGTGIVDEQIVAEVLRHQEDEENVQFMARTATVAHSLAAFEEFLHRGKRLEAILITNGGHPTESLLGIVTVQDIPKLNQAVNR
ncbi:CBS domain-containing protein [Fimbriiglobus ruber]|uniref:Putative CBS domain containing protein n=1 Tax=Fimbriiglobus ruber TaxID=1908690 RepID=A0A225DVU9_9BACT|nr:CBS domain-containing protein [Fimbriiglobus ruber]OWK45502.1 putative CBS domain containing protein [Fimbriiglobus ruber]